MKKITFNDDYYIVEENSVKRHYLKNSLRDMLNFQIVRKTRAEIAIEDIQEILDMEGEGNVAKESK